MKNFVTNLEGLNNFNKQALAQNTRLDIIGEIEAIMQYENHIASSNDAVVNQTLTDIVNEEKLHVGQLMGLLFYLDPISQTQFEKGLNEFYNNQQKN